MGSLDDSQGGLGVEMWAGTPRSVAERLLRLLPARPASLAVRDLQRRLLLSIAAAPTGEPDAKDGPRLIAIRLDRLAAMGDREGLDALLRILPAHLDDARIASLELKHRLLAGDFNGACRLVAEWTPRLEDAAWRKSLVFCQTLAGDTGRADLGAQLIRETAGDDPIFFTLLDALRGNQRARVEALPEPRPLDIAMARAAERPVPGDAVGTGDLLIQRALVTLPSLPFELRLAAAERGADAGALPIDHLVALYGSVTVSRELLNSALSVAEADAGPNGRAILFRAAQMLNVPLAQAQAIDKALALARERGRYPVAVRVYRGLLAQLEPAGELAWFAPQAAGALYAAGDPVSARRWLPLAEQAGDEAGQSAARRLWALARIAEGDASAEWDEAAVDGWWRVLREQDPVRSPELAGRAFALIEAAGRTVPDPVWRTLVVSQVSDGSEIPSPAVRQALHAAALAGRRGETVALAAIALGERALEATDPLVLRDVADALRAIGLAAEARALAREAAVAAGL